jgi:site-specific DNA-methyltransferase (adenine-specific)
MIAWVYGSGFPKSLNIGKQISKITGEERQIVGEYRSSRAVEPSGMFQNKDRSNGKGSGFGGGMMTATIGTSEWEGWGTQLKPSNEPIVMARKPLSEKTIVENVLKWGTGAINVDKSRVPMYDGEVKSGSPDDVKTDGRFPANTIHDGSEEVTSLFPNSKGAGGSTPQVKVTGYGNIIGTGKNDYLGGERKPFDSGDGSASRFFYCAKPSRNERDLGLENFQKKLNVNTTYGKDKDECLIKNGRNPENRNREVANHHPTIKPIKLMEYLVNMVTPKNGIVLDPFMGSGTTGMAVVKNGFKFIGVEREKDYFEIAEARVNYFANNKVELDYSEDEEEQTQKTKPNKKITNSLF